MPYCPNCGEIHDTYTAGCPYKPTIPMVYPNNFQPPLPTENAIEKKMDEIIRLLREIEYYLRKQNTK